jgi:phosphonate transport system permease protein
MIIKPIPVPTAGTQLAWKLDHPYTAKHLLIVLVLLASLIYTGQRTEMGSMMTMTVQAIGKLVGLTDESQVVRGLSRIGQSMWPPAIGEKEEVARLSQFDRNDLPLFTYIEVQERREQRMNLQTLKMDVELERIEYLVKPVGYLWTVFLKMVQTVEIAIWGTLLSVLLSIPLAYLAARNYTPSRFTYTLARGVISLLRSWYWPMVSGRSPVCWRWGCMRQAFSASSTPKTSKTPTRNRRRRWRPSVPASSRRYGMGYCRRFCRSTSPIRSISSIATFAWQP